VRYDIASPTTSETIADSKRAFDQLTRLVVLRVAIAVPDWVRRCVERGVANAVAWSGRDWSMAAAESRALLRNAELVGWRAVEGVEGKVSDLLAELEDRRPVSPRVLTALQDSVDYPASVLGQARVPKATRDRLAVELFPDDVYNIAPRSVAELHPMMPGLLASWDEARFAVLRVHCGA
jgi:hypothetical protein